MQSIAEKTFLVYQTTIMSWRRKPIHFLRGFLTGADDDAAGAAEGFLTFPLAFALTDAFLDFFLAPAEDADAEDSDAFLRFFDLATLRRKKTLKQNATQNPSKNTS
jgi:hypothetical protein